MAEKKQNSAIIYDGWRDSAVMLAEQDKSLAYDYLMAILDTQFYGERNTSNPILNALMVNVDFSLVRSTQRQTAASTGGTVAAHNRLKPYGLIYYLRKILDLDVKVTANIAGCSERTVSTAVGEIESQIEHGVSLDDIMKQEQQEEKYAEAYAKYSAYMQSTLL